jgi:hypothetical protein
LKFVAGAFLLLQGSPIPSAIPLTKFSEYLFPGGLGSPKIGLQMADGAKNSMDQVRGN